MIARTLFFGSPGRLRLHLRQLVWVGEDGVSHTFPIEDIGFVIIESSLITVSVAALQCLADSNVAVVLCDSSHMPSAQLLPYVGHSTAQETVEAQLAASDAVQGRLWRQIIRQKILNQAALMDRMGAPGSKRLESLAAGVKNYDIENNEAQAARIYFSSLAPINGFKRERDGMWPNSVLNYGYAILRAAAARAIVGSGMVCIRGMHHHNRYNPFCLADDIMEPYRPFVDQFILGDAFLRISEDINCKTLTPTIKKLMLNVLSCDVHMASIKRPLMIAMTYTTASLAKCYLNKTKDLSLPELKP